MIAPAVVVTELLVRARALAVVDRKLQRRVVEFEPSFRGIALSRGGPRGEQHNERAVANLCTSRRIVGPSEVRPLAEQRCTVMVGDELADPLAAPPREPLQPDRDAGV